MLALTLLTTTAAVVVEAPSASAGTVPLTIRTSLPTGYLIDVRQWSQYPGTTIDMWEANTRCIFGYCPGANQQWLLPGNGHKGSTGYFENVNSGLCLETDGLAGDVLYQWTCNGSAGQVWKIVYFEEWTRYGYNAGDYIINPASQLVIDIAGSDADLGARVIGWPLNSEHTDNQS